MKNQLETRHTQMCQTMSTHTNTREVSEGKEIKILQKTTKNGSQTVLFYVKSNKYNAKGKENETKRKMVAVQIFYIVTNVTNSICSVSFARFQPAEADEWTCEHLVVETCNTVSWLSPFLRRRTFASSFQLKREIKGPKKRQAISFFSMMKFIRHELNVVISPSSFKHLSLFSIARFRFSPRFVFIFVLSRLDFWSWQLLHETSYVFMLFACLWHWKKKRMKICPTVDAVKCTNNRVYRGTQRHRHQRQHSTKDTLWIAKTQQEQRTQIPKPISNERHRHVYVLAVQQC